MSSSFQTVLLLFAIVVAALVAAIVDELGARRGLRPPGFAHRHRRAAALTVLATALVLVVFAPLAMVAFEPSSSALAAESEPLAEHTMSVGHLFVVHAILAVTVGAWFWFGYARSGRIPHRRDDRDEIEEGSDPRPVGRQSLGVDFSLFARQFGLISDRPWREVGWGIGIGVGAWVMALTTAALAALLLSVLGWTEFLPGTTPSSIVWIASLPVGWRIAVSLSAGVVEELFFRGFLQPRIGIGGATVLFVLAHAGYGQVFMFLGLTVLSLVYGWMFSKRGNIWAAVVAHSLFDLIQMVGVIPFALSQQIGTGGPG